MIQVKTIKQESKNEFNFPKLMISISGTIVLFCAPFKGIRIKTSNNGQVMGEWCTSWDMDSFTDYDGTIELKNVY